MAQFIWRVLSCGKKMPLLAATAWWSKILI